MSDDNDKTLKTPFKAGKAMPVAVSATISVNVADVAHRVGCGAAEVLSFKDYGTHVVVVTRDGRKLSSQGE